MSTTNTKMKKKKKKKTVHVLAFILNVELTAAATTYIRYINLIIWLSVEMWFLLEKKKKRII